VVETDFAGDAGVATSWATIWFRTERRMLFARRMAAMRASFDLKSSSRSFWRGLPSSLRFFTFFMLNLGGEPIVSVCVWAARFFFRVVVSCLSLAVRYATRVACQRRLGRFVGVRIGLPKPMRQRFLPAYPARNHFASARHIKQTEGCS
jgi:hypothetical protein